MRRRRAVGGPGAGVVAPPHAAGDRGDAVVLDRGAGPVARERLVDRVQLLVDRVQLGVEAVRQRSASARARVRSVSTRLRAWLTACVAARGALLGRGTREGTPRSPGVGARQRALAQPGDLEAAPGRRARSSCRRPASRARPCRRPGRRGRPSGLLVLLVAERAGASRSPESAGRRRSHATRWKPFSAFALDAAHDAAGRVLHRRARPPASARAAPPRPRSSPGYGVSLPASTSGFSFSCRASRGSGARRRGGR